MKKEGLYHKPFVGKDRIKDAYTFDNFTDSLILNVCYDLDSENLNVFERAMANSKYNKGGPINSLEKTTKEEPQANGKYERYWFGSTAITRILLIFFDYPTIRYLNLIIIFILLMIAFYLISKNINIKIAMAFALSFLFMGLPIIPMSLQYTPVCIITLSTVIIINLLYKKTCFKKILPYLFVIIGCITAFMDLLTYPLLTFGIPIIILLLLENEIDKNKKFIDYLKETVKYGFLWSMGYFGTYFLKWVIASIVLNKNVIEKAWKQILFRADLEKGEINKFSMIYKNVQLYFNGFAVFCIVAYYLPFIIKFIKNKVIKKENIKLVSILLLIALLPYIWYIILSNHSNIHYWMTYRIQCITMLAILCVPILLCEKKNKKIIE